MPVSRSYVVSAFRRTSVRLKPDTTSDRAITDDRATRVVTVLQPGLLTTIQDEGRWGWQSLGVPPAGPMDPAAHRRANAALGNPREAATLEITVVGPELRFEHDAWLAVTGADLRPLVGGAAAPMDAPVWCRAGSVLRFGGRARGARAYVAIDGGIAVRPVLGSRATHLASGLGGFDGRALRAGDRIPLGGRGVNPPIVSPAATGAAASSATGGARLRVLPGPQAEWFDRSAFDRLEHTRYVISPQSDRMGYRLTGPTETPASAAGEMISDVAFTGGLQAPPSGEPILLMADRQTTGGYPQIAVVITADLPRAAQLLPGDWVEFEWCSRSEAVAALRVQEGQPRAIG